MTIIIVSCISFPAALLAVYIGVRRWVRPYLRSILAAVSVGKAVRYPPVTTKTVAERLDALEADQHPPDRTFDDLASRLERRPL